MPGAVEFLASYFVGKQLGAQQNLDDATSNKIGVTQAVLGLTPMSIILVNEIAKREAPPNGSATTGFGTDNVLTVPLSAFGTPSKDGGSTTTSSSTKGTPVPTPSTSRFVEREVPTRAAAKAGKDADGGS